MSTTLSHLQRKWLVFVSFFLLSGMAFGQAVPELMYYKFDAAGDQTNYASAPVGTNPAVLTGQTIGSTGQFGTALVGNGLTSTSNRLSTGWATSLPSTGWTISFWLNNFPATSSTTYYYFGDANASSFRCFTGGVAGNGNLLVRGGGLTDTPINGIPATPTVIHLVYTGTALMVYVNGVYSSQVAQSTVTITGTGPFLVGGYSSSNSINSGTLMDEWRMYNRALGAAEITATWNQMLPLGGPPVVTTQAATSITTTTATLNGSVTANNLSTTVTFEYGLTTAYGSTISGVPGTVTGNTATAVTANLTGLTPSTLYHFRVKGVNSGGTTVGADMNFTTSAPTPVLPTVVSTAPTAIAATTATMNGTVNANNFSSTVSFNYGLTTAYGSTLPGVPSPVTGSTVTAVSAGLTGLLPGTTYHYQVCATNSAGTACGSDIALTTSALAPTVVTNAATGISTSGGTLNGTITANGASTTCSFEYGLTTAYGSTVAAVPATVTGNTATAVSAVLTGLLANQTYNFRAKGVNAQGTVYGSNMTFSTSCTTAGPAGPVTGPNTACQGGTGYVYTVAPIAGAIGYSWTLPVGGTITAGANTNTITVTYGPSAVPGYVMVYGLGNCGNGSPSQMLVTVNAAPPPVISGPATVCNGSTGQTYTTEPGKTGYTWLVTGGTITGGSGTNAITVSWTTAGSQSVSVNYTNAAGCPAPQATVYPVTVNAQPVPTITGPLNPCQGLTVAYTTQTGQASYVWSVSAGGQIISGQGTATCNVKWNGSGAQTVNVNYANANGCTATTPTQLPVSVNAAATPTITGATSLCATSGYYNYTTQTGMSGYVWTVSSGGSIIAGQGTYSLTVYWSTPGAQTVTVNYNNASGCAATAPAVLPVTVGNTPPGAPGAISGPASVCGGQQGVSYSCAPVSGAVAYAWNLPVGATITSGVNTNAITVDFASNAQSGSITVSGNNLCGSGPASPPLAVTVGALPGAAGAITGSAQTCQNSQGVAYSVAAIANATTYNWTLPAGATIASGANTNSITVNFGTASGNITVQGANSCGSGTVSPSFAVTVNPKPPTPGVTQNGYVLTSSSYTGNQWYKDGTAIAGATSQTYTVPPTEPGYYWVKVTQQGCTSDESNHVYIQGVGVKETSMGSFSIYPIPNDGKFTATISWPNRETFSIQVYNELGAKVFTRSGIEVNGTVEESVDIRPAPAGVYTVVFTSADNKVIRKIIVNK
jgi:phosphodiesterase/alkaline phosphatase D-like protein